MSFFAQKPPLLTVLGGYLRTSAAVTTAMTVGDLLCQRLENRSDWDQSRTLRMAITGCVVSAPIGHTWMHALEYWVPGKTIKCALTKVACNAAFSPVQISAAFTSLALLEGRDLRHATDKIKTDLPNTFITGAFYWPIIGFLQFRYVPVDYRAITGSLAGTVWNTYLSSQANRPLHRPLDTDFLSVGVPVIAQDEAAAASGGARVPSGTTVIAAARDTRA